MSTAIQTVQPEKLLKELEELWKTLAHDDGKENASGVLRACAMTLIVLADAEIDESIVGETLAALMHEHPSRAIVLRIRQSGEPELSSRVLAQCWMPFGQRQQICCEQIEVTASASNLDELPSVLRGLTVADLPVVIWARTASLLDAAASESILRLAGKVIFDSDRTADPEDFLRRRIAQSGPNLRIADLAWARLTRWRECVAQAFESGAIGSRIACVREIAIEYSGEQLSMTARYLAAWFRHVMMDRPSIHLKRVEAEQPKRIERVLFSGDNFSATLTRAGDNGLVMEIGSASSREMFPPLNEYELLREELSLAGHDPVYDSVLEKLQHPTEQ